MLVTKIKEEKELEEKEIRSKKEKERERLARMMHENEIFREKTDKELKEVGLLLILLTKDRFNDTCFY